MRLLIAPASFKGSLSPVEAARAISRGLQASFPGSDGIEAPLADGGEGTLDVVLNSLGGQERRVTVHDPLGRPVDARFGLLADRTAFVESAQAAGLTHLTPHERNPMRSSSYGVGQLIQAALDEGAREIWIGLGGSATVDGGLGMLQALGARVLDADGRDVPRGGQGLGRLTSIDGASLDLRLGRVDLHGLCDVDSVLLGAQGARRYMPQKGATPSQCEELAHGLRHFAALIHRERARDVSNRPGTGAAGGLGAALAFLGAQLTSGSQFVLDALGVEAELPRSDVVVTGEGQIDEQTLQGKAIGALAELSRRHGCPVVALCGTRSGRLADLQGQGIHAVFSILPGPTSLDDAMAMAEPNLEESARHLGALLQALAR